MSRTLLSVSFVFLIVVAYAVPVFPSSQRHVSVEQALARRRRAAHHVAFLIRAAQLAGDERAEESALESGVGDREKRTDVGKSDAAVVDTGEDTAHDAAQQDVPVQSEPKQDPNKQTVATQSKPQQSEPLQSEPQQSEPQQSEPQQSEPKQSEPQQSEPQHSKPQQSEVQQSKPQQGEPQQGEPQQGEQQQQNETLSNPRSEPQEDASLSKQSMQPPFNPSVSTVGFVGAIATVIVAAILVWSKSSNGSLSPVQLASHAYQRVHANAQDTSASAQGSADADGWNAGWDDEDEWNPQPPSAKV